jgi:curved DNA-binding protein CbpA
VNPSDSFHLLHLSPNATLKEARSAYMRLVKRWHPDQFSDDPRQLEIAQEKLKAINAAYEEVKRSILAGGEKVIQNARVRRPSAERDRGYPPEKTEAPNAPNANSLFGILTHIFLDGFMRIFRSKPKKQPERNPKYTARKKPVPPGNVDKDAGDFETLFNSAVTKRTGTPYQKPTRQKPSPASSSKKTGGKPAPVRSRSRLKSRRGAGERVERIAPVQGVRGVEKIE